MNKRSKGAWGEDRAVAFLIEKEYIVMKRNYRSVAGEIDIIAGQGETIVFVEVKVLGSYGQEELGRIVGARKQRRIRETAELYLAENTELRERALRCDVIAIFPDADRIVHLENAF
jgi:putative endonuclease